jgi:hypothetical protein
MAKKESGFKPRLEGTIEDKWNNTNGNNFGEIISSTKKATKGKTTTRKK